MVSLLREKSQLKNKLLLEINTNRLGGLLKKRRHKLRHFLITAKYNKIKKKF
jgi:hypothetical protein